MRHTLSVLLLSVSFVITFDSAHGQDSSERVLQEAKRYLDLIRTRSERVQELSEELDRGCTSVFYVKIHRLRKTSEKEMIRLKKAISRKSNYERHLEKLKEISDLALEISVDAEGCPYFEYTCEC